MNQVKYLVQALLLLLFFWVIGIGLEKFLSTKNSPQLLSTIDFIEADKSTIQPMSEGKAIFSANCQTCHALDRQLTGPALRGVNERGPWTDRKNLIKWVHNPGGFIPTTQYTKDLAANFGQIMPSFPQLSDQEINSVFDYIKSTPLAYTSMPVAIR